jgi:hypothetical protein
MVSASASFAGVPTFRATASPTAKVPSLMRGADTGGPVAVAWSMYAFDNTGASTTTAATQRTVLMNEVFILRHLFSPYPYNHPSYFYIRPKISSRQPRN